MLNLSEILMRHHEVDDFARLLEVVREQAQASGELHLRIDVKPPYPDTPSDWEDRIEGAFSGVYSVTS